METGRTAGSTYASASGDASADPSSRRIHADPIRSRRSFESPPRAGWIEALRRAKRRVKAFLFRRLPPRVVTEMVLGKMPRSAQVEITTACNLRCPLCVTHDVARAARFLSVEALDNLLRGSGTRMKFVNLHLLGEPLMHRGVFDLVRACATRGVKTSFSTNGMLLDRHVDRLLDSGLSYLSVAIDGVDQADYSRYRIGGDLARVAANVKALLRRRKERGLSHPTIQVQMVMFSYNEDREDEARRFLASLGADVVSFKRPSYAGPETDSAARFLSDVDHESRGRRFARDTSDETRLFRNRPMCPQLERAIVLSDGRVVACCMDASGEGAFGNLNESSFDEIWRGPNHRELLERFARREFAPCAHCTLADESESSVTRSRETTRGSARA